MRKALVGALTLPLCLSAGLLLPGCGEDTSEPPPALKGTTTPGPMYVQPAQALSNPKIKEIMEKVGKGPAALQGSLVGALKQPQPASWDSIQGKSKEYADLTSQLSKLEPVKGDKDSWSKLSLAFADSAAELSKGAQAKDHDKTQGALDNLGNSCMACHRQHRVMGPGGVRPGGTPPSDRGGPPGGPGGPPPGGPPPGGPAPAGKTGGPPEK